MKVCTHSLNRFPVTSFSLRNGMKVYTFSVPDSARVYVDLWFSIGAKHEPQRLHGVSHFLEHMIFKGSERFGPGEIDRLTSEAGGFNNAATHTEFTHFYFVLPKRSLSLALKLLREMCTNPKIDSGEFRREREVVIEEIKQYADSPFHHAYLKHMLSFYTGTPWGHNILGSAESLNAMTPLMMRDYHGKYYSPENAALVVAGKLPEPDKLASLVDSHFGDWSCSGGRLSFRNSPLTSGSSREIVARDIESVYGFLSIPCWPRDLSKNEAALSTLIYILSGYFNSRLNQALKEEELLCSTIELMTEDTDPLNSLLFSFTTDEASKVKLILDKYRANLHRIANEPPSASELMAARAAMIAARVFDCENVSGAGSWLSNMVFPRNDLDALDRYLELERSIESEDVSEAASELLGSIERATLTVTYPKGTGKPLCPSDVRDFLSLSPSSTAKAKSEKPPEPELIGRLECGSALYGWRSPASSTFACRAYIPFDILNEPLKGISFTCNDVLLKGTKRKSASELSRLFENVGGTIASSYSPTHFGIEAGVMAMDRNLALTSIPEILAEASFDQDEIDKSVWATVSRLARLREQNLAVAWRAFQSSFLEKSPYGIQFLGEEHDLKKLTTSKIRKYAQKAFAPKGMVFCIAGQFNPGVAMDVLNRCFAKYPFVADDVQKPVEGRFKGGNRRIDLQMEKEQSAVVLGFPAVGVLSESHCKWEIANVILGGGQDSRLFSRLRDEESLAYSVHSMLLAGRKMGIITAQMLTSFEKREEAIRRLFEEIETLFRKGVTKREFEAAKLYLAEQAVNVLETSNGKCSELARNVLLGFSPRNTLVRIAGIRGTTHGEFISFLASQSVRNWGLIQVGPKIGT